MDRSIASRPCHEQVLAIVEFMEQHPALGLGQMRGMEGREESKQLWMQLTRTLNKITGPTRPMKSWMKYWADKKSTVRSKVLSSGGDPNNLSSNIEKKIWDVFLANDTERNEPREPRGVKQETHFLDETFFDDPPSDEPGLTFEDAVLLPVDPEDRQLAVMDKLVKVMSEQAAAVSQLAHAAQLSAQAMDKMADAAHIQARAMERLATSLECVGGHTSDVRAALADIQRTMSYHAAPT